MNTTVSIVAVLLAVATSARAAEQSAGLVEKAAPPGATNEDSASSGAFLPFSHAASIDQQRAYGTVVGGYDTARESASFEAMAEARVWGPFAVRAGAIYVNSGRTVHPSVGGRFEALQESRHGVNGALGVFYKPEGLTEPEGEIETIVSIGRHVGATYLLGNAAYGQDPEGTERDGEVRAAVLRPLNTRAVLGLDSRLRFDLGSSAAKLAVTHEATLDVLVGPSAAVFLGPVALLAHAGGSAVRFSGSSLAYGAFFLAGVGSAF